ncbi:DUF998 domain-containing protein [Congregibacter variabilis]|uniref:DUF998 domain-containing protein n=1 Tax=Congregibacter variabilis TaxID=3081200 RepID=A0ABZ0I200_9GAMM|nr:DUF998 domain-containing protein [Congregibacter sp. IMCC43200]
MISNRVLQRFVVAGVMLMLGAHIAALLLTGQSAMSSPISQLSRGPGAALHTSGLFVLALVQPALAILLGRAAITSRMWTIACWLMALNGVCLLFIAIYFLRAPDALLFGPDANDPLALLASNVGLIMGLLHRGLRQRAPRCALLNTVMFVLWLALIPVIPFIEASWLGAYERTVGVVLLLWLATLALLAPAGDEYKTTYWRVRRQPSPLRRRR